MIFAKYRYKPEIWGRGSIFIKLPNHTTLLIKQGLRDVAPVCGDSTVYRLPVLLWLCVAHRTPLTTLVITLDITSESLVLRESNRVAVFDRRWRSVDATLVA